MSTGLKRKRRPTYTEEALTKAIEDVKSGATINLTSRKYKIPRTTLHSRVMNKHCSRLGKKPSLSDEDEADLAKWIERMCSMGCSVSRNQIGDSVVLSLKTLNKKNPFLNKRPGQHWYDGFFRRHNLYEKVREKRRHSLKGIGIAGTTKWFADLNDRLKKKKLHSLSRTRTYSIGEVSLPFQLKNSSWCAKEIGPTVLVAANAAGNVLPPMIIFNSNDMSDKYDGKLPHGWSVEASVNSDLTAEFFYNYIKNHLYSWLVKNSVQLPIVLFLYQQLSSYLTQVLCDFCDKHKILLEISPPSPHHVTTPIEISYFTALRKEYTRKLKIFIKKTRSTTIGKSEFIARLEESLFTKNVEGILGNGFYKCGLYPLSAERYMRACIRVEPTEEIEKVDLTEEQSEESLIVEQSSVLNCIESNLDTETLESFKAAIEDRTWTGKVEDTNLFYLWRNIVKSQGQQHTGMEQDNNEDHDEADELQLSDSSNNEDQENEEPLDHTLNPNFFNIAENYKPLSYLDNSIIVVNPNAFIEDSDSDES